MSDQIARLNAALEGRYTIERQIGEGGMATVYLATDLRHEREVALKVLKPELAAVVGGERFLAEIKTTANLKHPHILPLFDSGQADSFLYYVMPYVEGESLRDRINRDKQLPVDEAVAIARKVAGALQHAHDHGVIHRDVKPGNILFQDNEPVVTDFGIALAAGVAGGTRLTETGLSVGTPFYMSPEQATGDQGMGPASDTYSLACVLYEMLVGDPPYPGSTAQAVLGKIIQGLPVSATAARKSVPANVDATIRKALEKLPADRFASAHEFAKALGDSGFRHGDETAASVSAGVGVWRPLAIAAIGVAVLSTLGFGLSLLRPEPQGPIARFGLPLPGNVETMLEGGINIAISRDGLRLAVIELGPVSRLWYRPLGELAFTMVPGTEYAQNPVFSPDGTSVAFTRLRDNGLATVALSGGAPQTIVADSVMNQAGGIAWGSDGMIYFRKMGRGLWRVPASGGEEEEVTLLREGERGHLWPDVLPNGEGILFTRDVGDISEDEIAIASLATGEIRVLFQGTTARYAASGHIVYATGQGNLVAVPFDMDRLEVTGPSRNLPETVRVAGASSASFFALSETGVLLHTSDLASVGNVPVWIDPDGSQQVLDPALTGLYEGPAISPDGRRVALQRQAGGEPEDIWVYDLDQRTSSRLTFGEGRNLQPFWSPDGTEVGFSSDRNGDFALYSRPADLGAEAELLLSDPGGIYEGSWSPDGRWLVYRRGSVTTSATEDLWYSAPHPDSSAHVIVDSPASENTPSLSPDGRWLAFASNQSGQDEIYVRPFPGSGGQTLVSVNGGYNPLWAKSGGEIYYMELDGAFTVATVRVDPDFEVVSRERLGSPPILAQDTSRHWDVMPADNRLFAIGSSPSGGVELVLVQNFFEELRQVVPD